MDKENPLVSVIVRTKDRPKLLKNAIGSIAAQGYRPIEVILVNDGGCDLDIEEIKNILGDVSLNYIRLEKNTGRAHAGNVGIENTKGEYIGFLDDDDEFYPDHIETLVAFLKDGADCIGAYTDSEIIQVEYDDEGNVIKEYNRGIFKSWDFSFEVLLFENYIPLMCSIFKREVLTRIGGFDETLVLFEDWELFIRATAEKPLYHIAKVTTKYFQWSRTQQIAFVDWPHAREYYIKVLTKHLDKMTPEVIYKYYSFKQDIVAEIDISQKIKNQNVFTLKEELEAKKEELEAKKEELEAKKEELEAKKEELEAKKEELEAKGKLIENMLNETLVLKEELMGKNTYIETIHNSFGWRLLHIYRTKIKARFFPPGTKREQAYGLVLKGLLTAHKDGMRVAYRKTINKLKQVSARKRIKTEKFDIPLIAQVLPDMIDRKVSLVIPTKNAGGEFKHTLEKLKSQTGIKELEIIIIDSGSEDNTPDVARQYGAKVLSIKPEEFNHGSVRNIGAENSTGDYIIFLSQDVIPIGEACIRSIITVMEKDDKIAAATVRQIPRSDADLFACWQLWYYYNKLLCLFDDRIVEVNPKDLAKLSPLDKRRTCQVDNIFSCVRKDIFNNFKFRPLPYAEDLDLGLRLASCGYKIVFLSSAGAIHSHNRNPAYYLRRSFVDIKSLIQLLEYEPIKWDEFGITCTKDLFTSLHAVYFKINSMIRILESRGVDIPVNTFINLAKISIRDSSEVKDKMSGEKSLDGLFKKLIYEIGVSDRDTHPIRYNGDIFLKQYFDLLDSLGEFLNISGVLHDKKDEVLSALYKLFAVVAGSNIGNFAFYIENKGLSEISLSKVTTILSEGV